MQAVAEITQRQDQLRKNITENETILNQLRQERGQLAIADSKKNAQQIKLLDKQIDDRRKDLENFPVELQILGDQLATAQTEEAQAAMNALLSQQKSAAGQMEAISKKLVKSLEVAYDLNIQLTTVVSRYTALLEQTGQPTTMQATCRPSEQLLQVVYETLKGELEGQPKNIRCQGQPPFVRI